MKICTHCQKTIPQERLETLPNTETCVHCSTEKAKLGFTVWDKKTPELVIDNNLEAYKKYDKADGRLCRLK